MYYVNITGNYVDIFKLLLSYPLIKQITFLSAEKKMSVRSKIRAGSAGSASVSSSKSSSVNLATTTVNERILRECHALYTDPENGLISSADTLGLKLLAPRKKISIMLIGNHSAGKSSFINW